jgi:hypothetical protein
MLFLPISRSWLFSRTAQRVYLVSALLALAFIATRIGVHTAIAAAGTGALNARAASVVRMLLLPEIFGSAILWIGMWYFWFSFDQSPYLQKTIWFTLLFFLVPFSTVGYYFVVYRRKLSASRANFG